MDGKQLILVPYSLSPYLDPVLRLQIHTAALMNIISFQEFIELLQRHVDPQMIQRVIAIYI